MHAPAPRPAAAAAPHRPRAAAPAASARPSPAPCRALDAGAGWGGLGAAPSPPPPAPAADWHDGVLLSRALEAPPLVSGVCHGVVGRGRHAAALRRELRAARASGGHVLISGEPGLYKDELCKLVHFGGAAAHSGAPLAVLGCARLQPWRLLGLASDDGAAALRPGYLDWLAGRPRGAALLLLDVHTLPKGGPLRAALARLLRDGTYQAADRHGAPAGPPKAAPRVRMLMTAEAAVAADLFPPGAAAAAPAAGAGAGAGAPAPAAAVATVRVPALRVRRTDVADIAAYMLRRQSRARGRPYPPCGPPTLDASARRLLECSDLAGNERELAATLAGAVAHARAVRGGRTGWGGGGATDGGGGATDGATDGAAALSADDLWSPARGERVARARANLLDWFPPLRAALRSPLWPEALNFGFTLYAFPAFVALLLVGPQDRAHSGALTLFWAYWWPGVLATYPLVGRLWCAVCPFAIWGEWAQRRKLASAPGASVAPWPGGPAAARLDLLGGWFIFVLFAAILLWEELWDLPNSAALSAALLLLITFGAVVCSLMFERRLWCRHLCPIGVNGMFAKLAFTELRADRGVCTAECGTYACLKGGPGEPPPSPGGDRGLPTAGCPLHSHPASLVDNRDCTLCGSCARGCAHANVALRLRPPGADLWGAHNATDSEVALMFLLLGALGVHHGGEVAAALGIDGWFGDGWLRANPSALPPSLFWPRAGLASALLLAPWALCAAADAAAGAAAGAWARARPPAAAAAAAAQQPQPPFTRLAYGWLPLVWAASLAHYTSLFASEAGLVLPRLADGLYLPHFVADALPRAVLAPSAAAFLQAAALVGGGGAATALTVALGRQGAYAPARVAAQLAGVAAAGAALWGLIVTEPFLAAPG